MLVCEEIIIIIIIIIIWQQFEVRWHCIRGRGRCYWSQWQGWQMQTVNTTSVTLNMTNYDTAYLFEVRVVTPQGRGRPTQYYLTIDALNGIPGNFTCMVISSNTLLVCHWSPPTDVNPDGFNVSSKLKLT